MTVSPYSNGHLLLIPGQLGGGNFAKLASFPAFNKWQERNLIIRVIGVNINYLLTNWPEAEWIGGTDSVKAEFTAQEAKAQELAAAKTKTLITDPSGYQYKREPMSHQRHAFLLSRDQPAFGLFMEQGTGKTKVTLDTACYLYNKGEIDFLVIVAWPNGVHANWVENELPADMSVPYAAAYWSSNYNTIGRRREYEKVLLQKNVLRVFAFSIESFASDNAQEFMLRILDNSRALLVVDQSASIKNHCAKRTVFITKECARLAPYRRILDGNPVAEGAEELYSQFKFLDSSIIGHDTWTAFRSEFCKIGFFKQIEGYKNMPELRRRIDPYCYRVLEKDCLELPERTYRCWNFDLGPEERRIFDDLKMKDLAFFQDDTPDKESAIDSRFIEESHALVKNLRLQQISSGWWPADEHGPIQPMPSRLLALRALLATTKGKAIIFSRFRADLELLADEFGKEAVSYHGGVSEDDRLLAKRKFMTESKTRFFLGQPRSAGIGHTLTAARHVIFYCNDHSLRLREECEKRAHRKGLAHPLTIWDLCARETHDVNIVKALRQKKEISKTILQDPDCFFLQYEK